MTVALLVLILALVVYGLERNNHRQSQPRQRLAGAVDVVGPDTARPYIH
jgi:HAMP domain-containing protein